MSANLPVPVLTGEVLDPPASPALPVPAQADSDRDLIAMWVARSASPGTRRKYRAQAARFLAFVAKPLALVRLGDVQAYLTTLDGQAPATRANATAALKSLFSFAQEIGYLRFNLGKVLKAPPVKNTLAERILGEADTLLMIRLEPNSRNRALLTLLYGAGLRISEVTGLRGRDLAARAGPDRSRSTARAARPASCFCPPTPGPPWARSGAAQSRTLRCSAPARAGARWTKAPCTGS